MAKSRILIVKEIMESPEMQKILQFGLIPQEMKNVFGKKGVSLGQNVKKTVNSLAEMGMSIKHYSIDWMTEVLLGTRPSRKFNYGVDSNRNLVYSTSKYGGLMRVLFEIEEGYQNREDKIPTPVKVFKAVSSSDGITAAEVAKKAGLKATTIIPYYLGRFVQYGLVERKEKIYSPVSELKEEYAKLSKEWSHLSNWNYRMKLFRPGK